MKKCESCGMPMLNPSDFGASNPECRYCKNCTYPGKTDLRPRYEIKEGMIKYYMKAKRWDRPEAEKFVDEYMAGMPAWQ
jgi:hypothetical protein